MFLAATGGLCLLQGHALLQSDKIRNHVLVGRERERGPAFPPLRAVAALASLVRPSVIRLALHVICFATARTEKWREKLFLF
jgi:hypothetical protein